MDVLRPQIIDIQGRFYRKNPIESSNQGQPEEEDYSQQGTYTLI
jgi:hypothetical protein